MDIVESLLRHGVDINTYDWVYNDYHHQFRIFISHGKVLQYN